MAIRPIFIPKSGNGPLIETVELNIKWSGGFAISQKQKNISALHEAARESGITPVLEISTKSMQKVGFRLSAFNLKLEVHGAMKSLESVYQSCKVFAQSGQHEMLMDLDPLKAKKTVRELGKGPIIGFRFEGRDFASEPKNAFYDWLYIRAISPHEDWIKRNLSFAAYSDIEFTPHKSLNCQARAVAEFHALSMRDRVNDVVHDFESFRELLNYSQQNDDYIPRD